MSKIDLEGRVAIVTGAGGGLGREYALLLAQRGAKVVVNDLGAAPDKATSSEAPASVVAGEIRAAGGEAVTSDADVCDPEQVRRMVDRTVSEWGRVDILVHNAGILRDRTFQKAELEDMRAVMEVHFWGGVNCAKAVWPVMRNQTFGRIVLTTSSSGLYGNFGQSAYGAAKMALVGLMNTLHLEGEKYNIKVNCLAPTAATRMTQDILSPQALSVLTPEAVAPAALALAAEEAPSKVILCAGAGSFERSYITLTEGAYLGGREDVAERILQEFSKISDRANEQVPSYGLQQHEHENNQYRKHQ